MAIGFTSPALRMVAKGATATKTRTAATAGGLGFTSATLRERITGGSGPNIGLVAAAGAVAVGGYVWITEVA